MSTCCKTRVVFCDFIHVDSFGSVSKSCRSPIRIQGFLPAAAVFGEEYNCLW